MIRKRSIATGLSIVLILAAVPLTGAVAATQSTDAEVTDTERASGEAVSAETVRGDIHPALRDVTGTRTVVVQLTPLTISSDWSDEETVRRLKSHAEQTQQPIVTYATQTEGVDVRSRAWVTNAVLVRVDTEQVALDRLTALSDVTRLHPNYRFGLLGSATTSGAAATVGQSNQTQRPAGPAQFAGTPGSTTYGVAQINAPDVWQEFNTRGGGATVAVLDSGVDATHPDLSLYTENPADPTYPGGWAEFDADGNRIPHSEPYDPIGHGTHVSGTVAGGAASGTAIGVAPDVRLLHAKVSDSVGRVAYFSVLGAMQWAIERDADVMTMSLGFGGTHSVFVDPVRSAEAAGVVVVAAIGNSYEGSSASPGNVYETLSVGASDADEQIGEFSSGEELNSSTDWVNAPADWPDTYIVPDVAAPGVNVTSAYPGGGYRDLQGTSMAAPHVAGSAALMIAAADRELTPATVKDALYTTARKPAGAPSEMDTRYGHGIVDTLAATRLVADESPADATEQEPNDDFGTATAVGMDSVVAGTLGTADVDVFAVDVATDENLTVTFDRTTDAGVAAVALYDENRSLVAMQFVGSGAPAEVSAPSPANGTYYAQVVDVNAGSGAYQLTVGDAVPGPDGDANEPNDDIGNATRLTPDEPVTGTVANTTDRDWFAFETNGQPIELNVTRPASGNGTLNLTVYDAQGQPITDPFELPADERLSLTGTLPADTFYLVVESGSDGGTGPYTVQYTREEAVASDPNEPNDDPTQATSLPRGSQRAGVVANDTDDDWFTYTTGGEFTRFALARPATDGTGTLTMQFFDQQNNTISPAFDVGVNETQIVSGTVPPGTYYIRVRSGADGGTGPYQLTFLNDTANVGVVATTLRTGEFEVGDTPTEAPSNTTETATNTTETATNTAETATNTTETATNTAEAATNTAEAPSSPESTPTPDDAPGTDTDTATPTQPDDSTPASGDGSTPTEGASTSDATTETTVDE